MEENKNIKESWSEIVNHPGYKEALYAIQRDLNFNIDESSLELSSEGSIYDRFVFEQSLNDPIDNLSAIVRKVVRISKEEDNLIVKLVSCNKEQGIIKCDGKEILGGVHTYPKETITLEFDKSGIEMKRTYEHMGLLEEMAYPVLKMVERYERKGLSAVYYEKRNIGNKLLESGVATIGCVPENNLYFQRLDIISPVSFDEIYQPPVDMQLIEEAKNSLTQEQYEGLKGLDNNGYFMRVTYQDESIKKQEENRTR